MLFLFDIFKYSSSMNYFYSVVLTIFLIIFMNFMFFIKYYLNNMIHNNRISNTITTIQLVQYLHYIVLFYISLIILVYSNYSINLFFSSIVFTQFQFNICWLLIIICEFLILLISGLLRYQPNIFIEYTTILYFLLLWFIGLFMITNLFTFIFFFELLSLTVFFLLILSLNFNNLYIYKNITQWQNNNINLFFYSFLYLFWISFISILNLFIFLIYFFKMTTSFDLSFVELLIIYFLYNINFDGYITILYINLLYSFIFFLKLGVIPFFLWKPNFFKSINYFYLLIYICIFYFFIFLYFLLCTYEYFYLIFIINLYFWIVIFLFGIIVLIFSLLNITNFKIFISFSSILNSFLLIICLLM